MRSLLNRQTRRVLEAALLSLGVYLGTWYWYKSTATQFDLGHDVKPVAFVSSIREDVLRRPASRLIWQMLNSGEPLYPGEAIKTSAKGEVRIQFTDSKRYIDLDPDSLIVINQNKNEISLDLMDGSIFVAGNGKDTADGPALTLKSAQGKVDLSNATASLSKSDSGKVEVQVLKGKVKNESGQELNNKIQIIKMLTPKIDQPTVINPDSVEPVKFSWSGAPAESHISLWLGASRKDLKSIAQAKDKNFTVLEKKLPIGKYFYKLVASAIKTKEIIAQSEIYRLEVLAKYPPGAISPLNNANLVMGKVLNPISFKWSNPKDFKNIILEIATDLNFKKIVHTKEFSTEEISNSGNSQSAYTYNLGHGEYFWRLSSAYEGIDNKISSKPLKFSVAAKPQEQVNINWLPRKEVKAQQYFVGKPLVKFFWESEQKKSVKQWKLQLWPTSKNREPSSIIEKISENESLEMTVHVPSQGLYTAILEAYNEYGTLLAKSEFKNVELAPLPILKAPLMQPEVGDLKADAKGNLSLNWTYLENAKAYHLVLLDKEGKEIKRGTFVNNKTTLINLFPGQYQVDIYATDTYDRMSARLKPRLVIVPETGGTRAPKLKKVKVN